MKHILCFITLLCMGVGCTQIPVGKRAERPDSTYIEQAHFMHPDTLDMSEFPPKPKGYIQVTDSSEIMKVFKITPSATILTEQKIIALRQRAEADKRLKKALGIRYAFLGASRMDAGEKQEVTPKQNIRLAYINYTTNRAVHVLLSEDSIIGVQVQPKEYQPPESDEEIAIAADIVRSDARYKQVVQDLLVYGILTQSPKARRYILLMFEKPNEPATFSATVDLTASKVVAAGPIRRQ